MLKTRRKRKEFVGRRQQYRRVTQAVNKIFAANVSNRIPCNNLNLSNEIYNGSLNDLDTNRSTNNKTSNNENFENVIVSSNFQNDNYLTINAVSDFSNKVINNSSDTNINSSLDNQSNFMYELMKWATERHISHLALTELLHILSPYHPELPLDSRTLLNTPSFTRINKLETGEFCYLGLNIALKNVLSQKYTQECLKPGETLKICFNIDGIPLFKSNKLQLWPILGLIKNFRSIPFIISIFCGTSKPKPLNLFLRNFIDELNDLLKNGFDFNGNHFKIEIHSFICDAPARAFLKCTKTHSGYSSCDKCIEPGEYYKNKVVFTSETAQKRTDDSFRKQIDDDHHHGLSPLIDLPIDLITSFPTDYMHNICLGVMRKLLNTWVGGPLNVRLPNRKVQILSQCLINLRPFIPLEFNRKPRSLNELAYWKATEFRTFLIYIGPLVLKDIVDKAIYKNFLLLHVAISILISQKHINDFGIPFARECLLAFINHCKSKLYGLEFAVYNIHLLTHICDDVEIYGPLDEYSAFPFENYLGHLKKLIRSSSNPLQQLHRRVQEINSCFLEINKCNLKEVKAKYFVDMEHKNGPLLNYSSCQWYKQYKKISFTNVSFSINRYSIADSYCNLRDNTEVIEIHNIVETTKGDIFIIGKHFIKQSPLYLYPCDSSLLNIYILENFSNLKIWPISLISSKCIVVPYINNNTYVCFPIIHID